MTLQRTVDTLIEMDEPEALLETILREAQRKSGPRWKALASVLGEASVQLDLILNPKPAGPDFRPPDPEFTERNRDFMAKQNSAKGNSQPQTHEELTHADATDAAPEAVNASPAPARARAPEAP